MSELQLPRVEPIGAAIRRAQRDRDVAEWDKEDQERSDFLTREINALKAREKAGEVWSVNF